MDDFRSNQPFCSKDLITSSERKKAGDRSIYIHLYIYIRIMAPFHDG